MPREADQKAIDLDLLSSALDRIEDGVAILDGDRRLIYMNAPLNDLIEQWAERDNGAYTLDGLARAIGEDPLGVEELRDRLLYLTQAADGRAHEVEGRTGRSFRLRSVPLTAENHLLTLSETTVQKQSERLAHERAEQLEAILEHVPHGVAYLNTECVLVLANDEFYEAFDFPRDMGPGTPGIDFTRLILERQTDLTGADLDDAARERLARIYRECEGGAISWDTERRDDGTIIEIRRHVPPQGTLVETYIDVTERENALREAQAAVSRYRAVVEDQTEMICRFDKDFRLTFANAAYREAFEKPGEDLIGKRFLDLIPEEDTRASIVDGLRKLTPKRPLLKDTFKETTVSGTPRWQTWINRALFDEAGTLLEYQAVGRDVTMEREARDALSQAEKLSAMGSLLAGVSHELNNPLSIIVGQTQLLQELATDPKTAERAGRIKDAAERCARIVRTFLAMARQKPPKRASIDLSGLVGEALELVSYALKSSGIIVAADAPPRPAMVSGDRDQLIQVVVNLLINAQQALSGQDEPRRVTISIEDAVDGIALCISDNGPGVLEALRTKIFDPFFTTKPEGIGTGIGLAMCRNIVAAHDGRLDYRPADGGGAEFRVVLPRAAAAKGNAAADRLAESWDSLPTLSILFVDDEPGIADTAREIVEIDGHRLIPAENGRQALEIAEKEDIDVVITDLRMPVMDGPALWRALDESGLHPTDKIGFVTGDTLSPDIRQFLEKARAPLAEKPLAANDLRRLIVEIFSSGA